MTKQPELGRIYTLAEFDPSWIKFLCRTIAEYKMPTELVLRGKREKQNYLYWNWHSETAQTGRIYNTDRVLDSISSADMVMIEIYHDYGNDGHINQVLYGHAFVEKSNLLNYLNQTDGWFDWDSESALGLWENPQ